jgi:spore germination protein (amino acid permease)
VLREFGEDMKTITLEDSPISFIILFFLIGMIAAGFAGIEAIARLSAFVVPIIIAGYYFIVFAVAPYFDISAILPILGNGVESIFIRGASKISAFSSIFIIFLLAPFLKTNKNFRKTGYSAIIFSAVNLVTSVLIYLIAFPYPTAIENFLPIYQLARLINYGRFFQRVESGFVFIWVASALIYLSTGFFFILHVFRKTFGLKYYKPLIIPMSILIFNISLLPPNLMTAMKLDTEFFRSYIWIITFIIPIVVLLLARVRLKSAKKRRRSDD